MARVVGFDLPYRVTAKLQSSPVFTRTSTQYGDCDQTWFLSFSGSHNFFIEGISIKIIIKLTSRGSKIFGEITFGSSL